MRLFGVWLIGSLALAPLSRLYSQRSAASFASLSDSGTLDGIQLRLSTFVWRDFMPITPPNGTPLMVQLIIAANDSGALPRGIHADSAWVVNGALVWATRPTNEPRPPGPPTTIMLREGPKWGPGTTVDVIVRLRDAQGGAAVLLRAVRQPIQRSD